MLVLFKSAPILAPFSFPGLISLAHGTLFILLGSIGGNVLTVNQNPNSADDFPILFVKINPNALVPLRK